MSSGNPPSDNVRRFPNLQNPTTQHAEGGDDGDGGNYIPDMSERLGRLEGTLEGLKHGQNMTLGAITVLAAFIIGFGIYSLQKMDALNDKVSAVPGQVSSDLRDLTKTLAESITAAKQQQPQVILMPAPQIQNSPKESQPKK